ncbi:MULTISPECIES: helix-turn-helix domain-containing protein [Pseudomonas]|uniref:helix-turn-helix domain-containing protein n=1 Tax=Pseudomonas TaxID=286 RepID=UPI0035324BF7
MRSSGSFIPRRARWAWRTGRRRRRKGAGRPITAPDPHGSLPADGAGTDAPPPAGRGQQLQAGTQGGPDALALERIRAGRLSVEEIAQLLGYSDVANFRRAFRQWEAVAPSEYLRVQGEVLRAASRHAS